MGKLAEKFHLISAIQWISRNNLLKIIQFIRIVFTQDLQGKANISRRFLLYVTIAVFIFFIWAASSQFDQIISSEAKTIPFSKLQTVQHFEGGIVKQIHVRAGQNVSIGMPLISLNPLEAEGGYQSKKYDFMQSLARIQRLESEYTKKPANFSKEIEQFSMALILNEKLLIEARGAKLQSTLASFDSQLRQRQSELVGAKRTLALVSEERDVVKKLVERGLEPKLEAVRAEKTYAEATAKVESILGAIDEINDRKSVAIQEQRSEILSELAKAKSEFSQLEQAVMVAADKSERSILKSPIEGVVNRVLVSTLGGVLKAGEPAVEIVPAGSKLIFETKIKPNDIGFIKVGQKAFIKLSTYDFSIFGSLSGRVEVVGSDSIPNEKGETFYIVKVELEDKPVTSTGLSLELISGMTAQIDIITGKRSVLSYLTSPITKTLDTAMREK
jgi:adhesin transport system membrane fusion protein